MHLLCAVYHYVADLLSDEIKTCDQVGNKK